GRRRSGHGALSTAAAQGELPGGERGGGGLPPVVPTPEVRRLRPPGRGRRLAVLACGLLSGPQEKAAGGRLPWVRDAARNPGGRLSRSGGGATLLRSFAGLLGVPARSAAAAPD